MEVKNVEETKNKQVILALVLGIVFLLVGLGLVIGGYILNMNDREAYNIAKQAAKDAFVPANENDKFSYPSYEAAWYIYTMMICGAAVLLASAGELYFFFQNKFNIKKLTVKQMCVIAIFAAISFILYYFAKFNLPFFPSWLDIQFSELPALLASFMYGPVAGAIIIVLRFVVKLPGTSTAGVGELADVLIGLTLVIISGIIYKKHRTLKGALVAMVVGMLSATVMATVANWLILIPAYMKIAHFPMAALVGAMSYIKAFTVTEKNFMVSYLFIGVVPFNLFRYLLVFIITMLVYKKLHQFIEFVTK